MKPLPEKYMAHASQAAHTINEAMRPLKLLKAVDWPDQCREQFVKLGKLPNPVYETIDITDSLKAATAARALVQGDHVVFDWLRRQADILETTAYMLDARGTKSFSVHSQTLFGQPSKLMIDRKTRVIDLAHHMDTTLADLDVPKLVMSGYENAMDAESFAVQLRPLLDDHFDNMAPDVLVSTDLAAKAVASTSRIRIRADASFTSRDVEQLLQHEAFIHVATGLNGREQSEFPLLKRSHAGTTEIQEGLAVFAEMISGAMDPVRFRRLADRVIAIQMTLDGADFKEIYDFYLERTHSREDAYENTRRIFRGGILTGGAPFTKDMVYLNGLLRVHNFMRSVVKIGRADLIRLLFVGKLDLEDIPALTFLAHHGHLNTPKFLPPWVTDLRFLVSYLAYSSFLNQVKMPGFQAYYEDALKDVPVVWDFA